MLTGAGNRVGPESGRQTGDQSRLVPGSSRTRGPAVRVILSPSAARILIVIRSAGRHRAVVPSGPAPLNRTARPALSHNGIRRVVRPGAGLPT